MRKGTADAVKRWWFASVFALCAALVPFCARAQSAPAEIEVRVSDAAGAPLADARVYITGPLSTSSLTPRDGTLRFSDVDPGLYHLRVTHSGYNGVDVDEVEALAGMRKIVDVTLTRTASKIAGATPSPSPAPGDLKEIGRVQARAPVTVSTVDVDEGNAIRRISENLADALDKIAGVSVFQTQQGNTLTISLRNADPSQTTTSIGGAAVGGAGAGTLQAVAADLSTGVSADSASSIGAVGGSVNYRTLQPTRTWQGQLSGSYGTYERTSAQLSLSGSYHKLGIALQHATRGGDSVLSGLRFLDTSGETYVHDGSFDRIADFVKLRYPLGKVTLTGQFLAGTTNTAPLCDQWVTTVPCGYGPGGLNTVHVTLGSVFFQGLIGNVSVAGQVTRQTYHVVDDELGRVVGGIAAPFSVEAHQSVLGFSDYSTFSVHRHTFLLNIGMTNGSGTTTSTGAFQGVAPIDVRSTYTVVGDTVKFSDRWSATLAYGKNVNLAQSQSAADISIVLTPSRQETLTFGSGIYGSGTQASTTGFFGDPGGAQYDCAGNAVVVTGPSDPPAAGLLNSTSITYSRRGRRGTLQFDVYDQRRRGGTLNAQYPLAALAPGAVPPGYLAAIANFWHQTPLCGAQAFDPSRVYVGAPIAGTSVRSRGMDASGQLMLGRSVIAQPSYSVAGATLVRADPRLLATGSAYALGAQLPNRPLHRAGLLLDAIQKKAALEWVVNGTWVSANNPAGLSPYVTVAAGVTWIAKRGRLSLFANNLFNTDSGLFARTEFAQAQALQGGGTFLPIPTLLAPRTYTLLYSARMGR